MLLTQSLIFFLVLSSMIGCSTVPTGEKNSSAPPSDLTPFSSMKGTPAWFAYDKDCERGREQSIVAKDVHNLSACDSKDRLVKEELKKEHARGATHVLFLGPESKCREQPTGNLACRTALKCDLDKMISTASFPLSLEGAKRRTEVCQTGLDSKEFLLFPVTAETLRLNPNDLHESTPIAVKLAETSAHSAVSRETSWSYFID